MIPFKPEHYPDAENKVVHHGHFVSLPTMLPVPPRYFLYAEDDLDDQLILIDILREIDPDVAVITCGHGRELMQFLEALQPGDPLPCCIVLDINMPVWDGIRTLQALKQHAEFAQVTVVMFTTSNTIQDAERCRRLGAASFLTKPVTKKDFIAIAREFSLLCALHPAKK